ncbi:24677_t:CDS:2, partial [Dentiscutata erythropus]
MFVQLVQEPSAQNGGYDTLDKYDEFNKITNMLDRNIDEIKKEISNVLLRNMELGEQLEKMQRRNKELENQPENNRIESQKTNGQDVPNVLLLKNEELEEQLKEMQRRNKELENNRIESQKTNEQDIHNVLLLKNKELEEQLKEMQRRNEELECQVENHKIESQKTIERLANEASKYQSALGRATSVRLGDDDLNNMSQLREDIKTLKKNLEYLSAVKPAKHFDINKKNASRLLKQYGCTNFIDDDVHCKSLLQAAMQRYILESSIEEIGNYLSRNNHQVSDLETQIVRSTDTLLNMIGGLSKYREGSDNVTPTLPIKLRQQIYSVLSNRGFNRVVSSKGTIEHSFISNLQEKLILTANHYRIVKNPTKMMIFRSIAAELARDIVKIFFFRLKVQEQKVDSPFWFECNAPVNPDTMEGSFDPENCQDNVVQICAFPLICIDLKNDEKRKILSQANIHIR